MKNTAEYSMKIAVEELVEQFSFRLKEHCFKLVLI